MGRIVEKTYYWHTVAHTDDGFTVTISDGTKATTLNFDTEDKVVSFINSLRASNRFADESPDTTGWNTVTAITF